MQIQTIIYWGRWKSIRQIYMCFIWKNVDRYITRKWVFLIASGENSQKVFVPNDAFCGELSHLYLFPTGKFVLQTKCPITLSSTKYLDCLIVLKGFRLIKTIWFSLVIQKLNLHRLILQWERLHQINRQLVCLLVTLLK